MFLSGFTVDVITFYTIFFPWDNRKHVLAGALQMGTPKNLVLHPMNFINDPDANV